MKRWIRNKDRDKVGIRKSYKRIKIGIMKCRIRIGMRMRL